MGGPMGIPVAASQSRAVLSLLPVSDDRSVGVEGRAKDPCLMHEGSRAEFACFDVPEPRPAIFAAGEEGLAVGAEHRRTDATGVR